MSDTRDAQQSAPEAPAETPPPLKDAATGIFAALRRQTAELLDLFTLEVRYSGLQLGKIAGLGLVAGLAFFTGWGCLLAAAGAALIEFAGWPWSATLALLMLLNILMLAIAVWLLRGALKKIGISNTRQALGMDV